MRYRNPKFKRSIRDEIKPNAPNEIQKKPQAESEEKFITPSANEIKRLWWSKYSPELKNPQVKSEEDQTSKTSKKSKQ